MADEDQSVGDPLPPDCELIELRVTGLQQLFNPMDASPFRDRDLDEGAEAFIEGWAREAPRGAKLALLVNVGRAPGPADEPAALRDAVQVFFSTRAQVSRSRLRELLRIGRVSLLVGLTFLAVAVGVGDLLAREMKGQRLGELLREGMVIIGWVAMWRPLEIFLYGWWPIRTQARLYDRLGAMPVRIAYQRNAAPESWRTDWPAVSPARKAQQPSRQGPSSRPLGQPDPADPGVVADRGPVAEAALDPTASAPSPQAGRPRP